MSAPGGLPVVALVGRPNVGKSTLFNPLTRTRDALVADLPGLTRDRQYGIAEVESQRFVVVDTGGIGPDQDADFRAVTEQQAHAALDEADVAVLMVDARAGITADDSEIARSLRRRTLPVILAVNKSDGLEADLAVAEFHRLGLGEPLAIAAVHRRGLDALCERLAPHMPEVAPLPQPEVDGEWVPRVAVIGRPNVGKSTLVNRLLHEERVVAADAPGATRDSIELDFVWRGQDYKLVDTAGLRRKSKVDGIAEKFSAIKTLQAIERADVVIAVIDARSDVGQQDARVLGYAAEAGRSLVIAVNKWDNLDDGDRNWVRSELDRKLPYLDFAPLHTISALKGSGLGELMKSVQRATEAAQADMSTAALTKALEAAVHSHQPPLVSGRRIKLRYAHQGAKRPPTIIIHGNQTQRLNADYKRYLANVFRKRFDLYATPVKLVFKTGDNPYEGKRQKNPKAEAARKRRAARRAK